jgi:hypothetical protein
MQTTMEMAVAAVAAAVTAVAAAAGSDGRKEEGIDPFAIIHSKFRVNSVMNSPGMSYCQNKSHKFRIARN